MRVLHTIRKPAFDTNPFIELLVEGLPPTVRSDYFSWRTALLGDWDVLHLHWPENLVAGRRLPVRIIKRALSVALLARLALRRAAVVYTVHNERPHERQRAIDILLTARLIKRVAVAVTMSRSQVLPAGLDATKVVIPHGHYRSTFTTPVRARRSERRRMVHIGLIRPYKNVDAVVLAAYAAMAQREDLNLHVIGRPATPAIEARLRRLAADATGIALDLRYADAAELEAALDQADLVVLNYSRLENSGVALLALSRGVPVIVSDSPAARELQESAGPEYVRLFPRPLTAAHLLEALDGVPEEIDGAHPTMQDRDWDRIGVAYSDAYATALRKRRGVEAARTT